MRLFLFIGSMLVVATTGHGQSQLQKARQGQQQFEQNRKGTYKQGEELQKQRPDDIDEEHDAKSTAELSDVKLPFGLPSWEAPMPSINLEPIFGNQFTSEIKGKERIYGGDVELGLRLQLEDIPIPVVPGIFINMDLGHARGGHSDFTTASDIDPNNSYQPVTTFRSNQRSFIGGSVEYYMDSLRIKAGLEEAVLTYDALEKRGLKKEDIYSSQKGVHLGARLPGTFSIWQSYRDYRAYENDADRPLVKELDYYLHTDFKLESLDLRFDAGLGVSEVRVWSSDDQDRTLLGHGFSRTVRSTMTWDITEDWLFEMYLKYAFNADEGLAEAYNALRLPTQELNRPPVLNGTPEDTLNFWAFTGMKELVEDLTLGLAYSLTTLRYGKSDSESFRMAGPIVEYSYEF